MPFKSGMKSDINQHLWTEYNIFRRTEIGTSSQDERSYRDSWEAATCGISHAACHGFWHRYSDEYTEAPSPCWKQILWRKRPECSDNKITVCEVWPVSGCQPELGTKVQYFTITEPLLRVCRHGLYIWDWYINARIITDSQIVWQRFLYLTLPYNLWISVPILCLLTVFKHPFSIAS